ncbi:hypothetical protein ACTXT7_001773 [Hymenolepis weldensis]
MRDKKTAFKHKSLLAKTNIYHNFYPLAFKDYKNIDKLLVGRSCLCTSKYYRTGLRTFKLNGWQEQS